MAGSWRKMVVATNGMVVLENDVHRAGAKTAGKIEGSGRGKDAEGGSGR